MIRGKLDDKTLKLLSELEEVYNISFEEESNAYCRVYTINGKSTIFYNPEIINSEGITHELLHIWLQKYNYWIGGYILILCEEELKLKKIFNEYLCNKISNFFDHYKMYPKFLEMGYSIENFLSDGLSERSSVSIINSINLTYHDFYISDEINFYIGSLIAIYSDHINRDYSEHFELLKLKNAELFEIVTSFWQAWQNLDITNINAQNSDSKIVDDFFQSMKIWIEDKKLV